MHLLDSFTPTHTPILSLYTIYNTSSFRKKEREKKKENGKEKKKKKKN